MNYDRKAERDELYQSIRRDLDQILRDVQQLMLEERLERFRREVHAEIEDFRAEWQAELQQTLQVIRERGESPDRTNEKDPGGAATPRDQSVSYIHKEDLHE